MTELASLWLPIILSAVAVFIVSSIIHMLLPLHKDDYLKVPEEDKVMDSVRQFNIPPGDYMMPRAESSKDFKSPEFLDKMNKGPIMIFTVKPNGQWGMGKALGLWFLYSVIVSFFAAYISGRALPVGADYMQVFRFIGATSFMGYSLALMQSSIWYSRKWSTTLKSMLDGLLYAMFTAGVFGWLWPR